MSMVGMLKFSDPACFLQFQEGGDLSVRFGKGDTLEYPWSAASAVAHGNSYIHLNPVL
jgi:hypothetical protein